MSEIHGNIEGIRKSTLTQMQELFDYPIENDCFLPEELMGIIGQYSASFNREIAIYITRDGEIADIIIGRSDSVDLPDLRLRRSETRLSMIRCIHTHPNATGKLSGVDISALKSMRFDAMCAFGLDKDGRVNSVQCGFNGAEQSVILTELVSPKRIPHEQWLMAIEESDQTVGGKAESIEKGPERAVLVGIESEESLAELEELAKTAGAITVEKILQKRAKPDTAFCIGRGKAEEIALLAQAKEADLIIFDEVLSGSMQKNLEEILRLKVIDRTALILDIFAGRAQTREGKLQVEMAQLQYRSQRLLGQGLILSRLAGGIGTRGPGESKLEVNRRRIRERLNDLRKELEHMGKQRNLRRASREKNGIPVVALVGYTNAGKSTLFNKLTGADVYVENQLFATLDSVSRPIILPHGAKALLVDTVGFIRKLPHEVVNAFRATLEEAKLADVLVIVSDGVDEQWVKRHGTVVEVLESLGATEAPRIDALNKCDMFEKGQEDWPASLFISAQTGEGLDELLLQVEKAIAPTHQKIKLCIPFDQYHLLNTLHELGGIENTEYTDEGTIITIMIAEERIQSLLKQGATLCN